MLENIIIRKLHIDDITAEIKQLSSKDRFKLQ